MNDLKICNLIEESALKHTEWRQSGYVANLI